LEIQEVNNHTTTTYYWLWER